MPNGASYRQRISITLNRSFDLQTFTLWQLPSQTGIQMNSYVLRTAHGEVIAIDGGFTEDAGYLKGFLAALGNHVAAWFITHQHIDHIDALTEVLQSPGDLQIDQIYASLNSPSGSKPTRRALWKIRFGSAKPWRPPGAR